MPKRVHSLASAGLPAPQAPARRNASAQTCVLLCERHLADAMSGHVALPQIVDRAARAACRPTSFGPPVKHQGGNTASQGWCIWRRGHAASTWRSSGNEMSGPCSAIERALLSRPSRLHFRRAMCTIAFGIVGKRESDPYQWADVVSDYVISHFASGVMLRLAHSVRSAVCVAASNPNRPLRRGNSMLSKLPA
jgi:hypothetical protein